MKYPASRHYSHLKLSEPIPEIEPRVDERTQAAYQAINRHALWVLPLIMGVQVLIGLTVRSEGWKYGLAVGASFSILGLLVVLIALGQKRIERTRTYTKDPWGVPIRLQISYYLFYFLTMWGVLGVLTFLTDGILGGLMHLSWFVLMFGAVLVVTSRFARQPGQISCERCDYPLVGLTLPADCPECGRALLDLSYATDRPRVRDGRMLAIGLALVVFTGSIGVLRFVSPGVIYAPLPRAAMVQLAASDRDAFDELMTTAMNEEEELRLFEAMYRGGTYSGWSYEQREWFGARVLDGALSREQLDSLYVPFSECWIEAPERGRVGEPITVRLAAEHVGSPGAHPVYFFEGFRIDDDPILHATSDSVRHRSFLASAFKPDFIQRGYVPAHTWVPDSPGEVTIRARLVFVLGRGYQSGSTIDWSAQGDARFPTPPIWMHEVELEHMIEILP